MDPRLVEFYDQELKYLRETAREFGAAYPTLAARLGVNTPGEADPYVERLLEGVAFLAARVQLKLNDEFPKFTQHLLDAVYPHYLSPTPSMAVLSFQPKANDPALNDGVVVPRGSACTIGASEPNRADCVFTTGADVRLWPVRVAKVDYLANRAAIAVSAGASGIEGEGGFLIRLETTGPDGFDKLAIDELTFYLGGAESLAGRIYEQIAGNATGVSVGDPAARSVVRAGGREAVRNPVYDDASAVLPLERRSFRGYRILQEYFACPELFQFITVRGLRAALSGVTGKSADLLIVTSTVDKRLAGAIGEGAFRLFCAPAVNLFRKRCDPVLLDSGSHEFRVLPERVRPLDYEIYGLLDVSSDGVAGRVRRTYHPVYRADPRLRDESATGFYAIRRAPTRTSALNPVKRSSDYAGSDFWISLTQLPGVRGQPDQLSVTALCTNRDIPDALRGSGDQLEFRLPDTPYVEKISAVLRPTKPRLPVGFEDARILEGGRSSGDRLWRLVSHLRPNYESLFADEAGAARLREHLTLYARLDSPTDKQIVDGLSSVREGPTFRRVASADPLSFARGRKVELTFDERNYPDGGAFLFAEVLDRFLSEFVSVNSFVETEAVSVQRGRIGGWGPRRGERPTI
ncbi:MAG: type VI secretion system baseplate subunit TssF [Micropepsaceae bacterium]